MKQRGRKSSESLGIVGGLAEPLQPPDSLTADERLVWQETVGGKPADYFGLEQGPLLVEYVNAVCRSRLCKVLVEEHSAVRDSSTAWRKEFKQLSQLADRASVLVQSLATSMRLTHQSVYRADKVIPKKGQTLWQRAA
jgi:hypothetical protein